ncbi:MAG: nidogen-like domain-containing protein [Planctomycetota bacterium]
MHRKPRTSRPRTRRALAALAAGAILAVATPDAHGQITGDGSFVVQPISAFGTDDGGRAASLPFLIRVGDGFFGNAFVNNNGIVSLGGFLPAYSNDGLGDVANNSGQAVIAPFFANVDTRPHADNTGGQGKVGAGTIDGRDAFIATWDRVGRHDRQFDLQSSFEVLLIDRSDIAFGDFDIVFNYGPIEWTVADPGDTPARVGFAVPDGQVVEFDLFGPLPAPAVCADEMLADALAITETPYVMPDSVLIEVRGGSAIVPGTAVVPTPTAAAAGMIGLIALAARRRRPQA